MFELLLLIYLIPVLFVLSLAIRFAIWLVKSTFRLALWLVRTPFVLLGRMLFGVNTDKREDRAFTRDRDRYR